MTDAADQAIATADMLKGMLDKAAMFAPLMGPAGPYVTTADWIAGLVMGAVHTVHEQGGKSYIDATIEVLQHLSPNHPNSPTLTPTPASPWDPTATRVG